MRKTLYDDSVGVYKTKFNKHSGTSYKEVKKLAIDVFRSIKVKSKRTPHIRSKYFQGEKIFLNVFWSHIYDKREKDRTRRLKFYKCAIELIKNSTYQPSSKLNVNNKAEVLHRFTGITSQNELFYVQIKENINTKKKYFISVFPELK